MKKTNSILVSIALLLMMQSNLLAQFGGGDGSSITPYLISTAAHLQELSALVINDASGSSANTATNGKHFKLTNDIDMTGQIFTPIGGWGSATRNSQSHRFAGTFDGGGKKIIYLTIDKSKTMHGGYVGLFGYAHSTATIKDLGLEGSTMKGTSSVGGVVGWNYGTVTHCYNTGSITGSENAVGGVVGENSGGTVTHCYSTGSITSKSFVGGVVGFHNGGMVINCYNMGSITGNGGNDVGGVVGVSIGNNTKVENCYNTGSVIGSSTDVGGVVGKNSGSTVINCYNTGSVTGSSKYVGGVVGENYGGTAKVENCYNTGSVTGSSGFVGGVVGMTYDGTETNCYYDSQTSGQQANNGIGIGKTTRDMKDATTVTLLNASQPAPLLWKADFIPNVNQGYPILAWSLHEFTVFFNSNDGSAVTAVTTNYNTAITVPTAPTKVGYTFGGWYKEAALTTAWDFGKDVVTDDITLYAKWTINTFIVSFATPTNGTLLVNNGNTTIVSGTSVPSGTVLTITTTPAEGYSLGSLKVNGVDNNSGSYTVTSETTIVAMFTAITINTFVVSFATPTNGTLLVNNGNTTIVSGTSVPSGTVLTITTTPAEGYSLGSLKVNGVDNNSGSYTVTSETTIVAMFTAITGIFNLKISELKLYPNPATTVLNLENIGQTNAISVEIFDITGRSVLQVPAAAVIDVSKLSQGIYTVKAGNYTARIIKN